MVYVTRSRAYFIISIYDPLSQLRRELKHELYGLYIEIFRSENFDSYAEREQRGVLSNNYIVIVRNC